MRRVPALAALLAALAAAGCGGCGGDRGGPPPERFLPPDVAVALVLPEAGRAAEALAALHATASTFPGTGDLAAARGALAAQLGFDPLDPDALAGGGLDPRRGAAAALVAPPSGPRRALLVLPAADPPRLESLLGRLARERLGAAVRSSEARGGASVVVLRTAVGAPAALAYALVERYALVSAGPDGPAVVGAAASLTPERALAALPAFVAARRALGEEAALCFLPPGSPALAGLAPLREGVGVGVTAEEGALRVRVAALALERAGSLRALGGSGAAAKLALRLAPGATLVLRWDGDPAALARQVLPLVPARDRAWLAGRGFDLETDLVPVLAPGAAAALSVAPGLELAGLSARSVRTDPLAMVTFEAVLPVRDVALAEEAAAKLERALRRGPSPPRDGVHAASTPSGTLAWTVDRERGRAVAAGGPPGQLDALRARLAGDGDGFTPPSAAARAVLDGGLGGAVLDVPRLVSSVRALPPSAFGGGPSGFVVRSVVNRFVEPAERLLTVSLRADLADDALLVTVEVEARPRAGAAR